MITDYLNTSILRLCQQPRSFEYISKNLNGFAPVETTSVLAEMEKKGELVCINNLWSVKEVNYTSNTLPLYPVEPKLYLQKYMGYFDFLKTPHPLDFEWRNSSFSLNRLLNKITTLVTPTDKLLFLGMPTLFATAILKDTPNTISLIERNSPIVQGLKRINTDSERFKIIESDIFTINSSLISQHYCVIMDPPWYTPHFFQFMWLAAKSICVGGLVIISLPPINTRPNIMEERLRWFSYCKDLGLCIETMEPQQLQYAMPFFEFNAFRAAGIKNILPFWRKGDLAIFRKIMDVATERPLHMPMQSNWIEREYKSSRIRIKVDQQNELLKNKNCKFSIHSLIKGDILPTVSSRDNRRENANIWTSGNRIFETNDSALVLTTMDRMIRGNTLTAQQREIQEFLDIICKFEQAEFKEYLDWIYYEMERQAD
jgi:hypothetical protein